MQQANKCLRYAASQQMLTLCSKPTDTYAASQQMLTSCSKPTDTHVMQQALASR
jgi:hypothetical protein